MMPGDGRLSAAEQHNEHALSSVISSQFALHGMFTKFKRPIFKAHWNTTNLENRFDHARPCLLF